jgi:Papain-like cysteine protease AvrRpt2
VRLGLLAAVVAAMLTFAAPIAAQADQWYRAPPAALAPLAALVRQSIEPPYRTQLDDSIYARSDCGPAVLGMVLDDYGIDQDTLDLRRMTHTYQGTWPAVRVGTALQHIGHVASDFGLSTYSLYDDTDVFHQWTVDEIGTQLQAGRLVVPLVRFGLLPGHEDTGVRWGHYILLYAIDGDGFRYQDPAVRPIEDGRARWISRAQLAEAMAPTYPARQALALGI